MNRSGDSLVSAVTAPNGLFVLPPNGALEIDPPSVTGRIEIERTEGNLNLGGPPVGPAYHPGLPDAVPGFVDAEPEPTTAATTAAKPAAAAAEEAVTHETGRIHLEVISGSTVHKRVENPREPVVCEEACVALFLIGQDSIGIAVVENRPYIEVVAVIHDEDLGGLGRCHAFDGIALYERACGSRSGPRGLVYDAVQSDLFARFQAQGRQATSLVVVGRGLSCQIGCRQAHAEHDDPKEGRRVRHGVVVHG